MESCVEEVTAALPAEAASQVLGLDPVELICVSRQAAAKDDPEVCRRDLKDYNQRNQCLRFCAVYIGRPLDCPVKGWPSYREGLCQALASRNPSLCLAVPTEQRAVCRAVLQGESHCGALDAQHRPQCRREAQVWRGVVKSLAATLPASYKPSLEMRATAITSGVSLPTGAAQFKSTALDHGILLADQAGSGDWLALDRNFAPQETYSYSSSPPLELELQVTIPATGTGTVSIGASTAQAKVNFRETSSYRYRTLQASSGTVSISKLGRSLAGQVTGTFSLELTDGVDKVKLEGQFDTFVRELVPLANVASYMRYRTGGSSSGYSYGTLSPDDVKKHQARIHKVKDGLYDIDPSLRDELVQDTSKLTDSGSISKPHGSTSGGFRFYSVHRNSLIGLLGFMDNDTIKKINGKSCESREAFFDAYTKFKKAPQILITLERSGSEVKVTYRVRKVSAKESK